MTRRDIPNIISLTRIVLVVPITILMVQREFSWALLLFFIAGVSDGLDGYLAKRNGWNSRLGSILDPLADKVLLVSSFITLGWLKFIPMWLVVMVLARDVIITVGGMAYHVVIGKYEMLPSISSKINTFFQIVMVLAIVFSLGVMALPDWLMTAFVYAVLGTTLFSGISYVWVWGRRAIREKGTAAK